MSESPASDHHRGSSDGMRVLSYLLSGPLFYGGVGWLVDHFVLHSGLLLPIGIVVGMVLSIILIIRRHSVAP